jgi:hypothetical protein
MARCASCWNTPDAKRSLAPVNSPYSCQLAITRRLSSHLLRAAGCIRQARPSCVAVCTWKSRAGTTTTGMYVEEI